MTRSAEDRTRIVRAWLDEGTTDLSRRVLEGVLREFPTKAQDGPSWRPWRRGTTALAGLVAATAAVIIVVLAGTRLLFGGNQVGGGSAGPSTSPAPSAVPTPDRSYREVGFIGLPPLGATPSGSDTTELVDWWALPTTYDGVRESSGPGYLGSARMYADGRLIWNEYYAGASVSTGWLEQRLSSEGLELVPTLALADPPDEFKRLDYIRLPEWLPASAWADMTIRPYVPSGFGVCLVVADRVAPSWPGPTKTRSMTLSEKLAPLSVAAADLLRDRARVPAHPYGDSHDCLAMTTDDARLLDANLRVAGLEQDPSRNRSLLEYHIDLDGDGPENWTLDIWFEPILPDGTITCSSCG